MQTAIGPSDARILITGGAGFIGSHLAEALVDGLGYAPTVELVDGLASVV